MPNRLADETSPYLRQHADNPVEWFPWGDEAFALAAETNRPVFLSVGYSSCHWCHVMAHESFEDPATAELMNDLFVNIKVDREERPDVDAIYMDAVQALTGRGGWPMSVWLSPDGRPFYAGTYFPPSDRQGMPSFTTVCRAVSDAWQERPDQVNEQAERLVQTLSDSGIDRIREAGAGQAVTMSHLEAAAVASCEQFDPLHGGFGSAPKFPHAMLLSFLTGTLVDGRDPRVEQAVRTSLDAMAAGGIYDHVGGGFARYSVDARWLVPHFEKMLYDQALLVRAYLHGYQVLGEPRWRRVVEETVDYVLRDLGQADGGFFSAEDADSEGVEGEFYVWSIDEIRATCGDDADAVIAHFGVSETGNFEGRNILAAVDRTAPRSEAVERCLQALFAARSSRVRPGLDDKVLAEWNALFLRGLAEAGFALGRDDWMEAARRNATFLLERLRRADGRLLRSWQGSAKADPGWGADGKARHLAFAADHAALIDALVTLAEVDDIGWLEPATALADDLVALFWDAEQGAFFTSGSDAEALVVRPVDLQDNATPSANSLAASALTRLARLTGDQDRSSPAETVLAALGPVAVAHPLAFAYTLSALRAAVGPQQEIALVGDRRDPELSAMRRIVAERHLPGAVTITWSGDDVAPLPLLEGRTDVTVPTAFVCEGYVCNQPVTSADALRAQLDSLVADQG